MGLFFRPRRPVLRLATGAATAGIAYHAGKRRAQQDVYNEQASDAYQTTGQPEPAVGQPPAEAAPEDPKIAQLARLGQLHDAGTLTDDEFTAAKAKILGI